MDSPALAPLYRLTGDSLLSARLLNVVAGTATVAVVYLLGAKVFNRRVGLVGAALLAVFPDQIFATSLIMTEPLFALLFVLILTVAVYALLGEGEGRPWQALLVGALIGAATLVRGEALLLVAIMPLFLFFRRPSRQVALTRSSLLVLGAAVVIFPWTARNVVKMHAPILISTSATEALWVGHHEGADGAIADFAPVADAYADVPNPEKEVEIGNEALRQALNYMTSHPLNELQLVPKKFLALYKGDSTALRWMQVDTPTIRPGVGDRLWTLSDTFYQVALVVALLGLPAWFSLRDSRKALLVAVVVAWTLLFSVVFFGDQRFHFAIIPVFCLWAGASLSAIGQFISREWRRRAERASV
jgi:4-amino-4-deoxy-L-arabinose transferase-like glycosyltransferase